MGWPKENMATFFWFIFLFLTLVNGQNCSTHDNNIVYKVPTEEWIRRGVQYSLYAATGCFGVVGNVFILVAVLRVPALRKQYFLLLLLTVGDLAVTLGYALSGFRRLVIIARGAHKVISTDKL